MKSTFLIILLYFGFQVAHAQTDRWQSMLAKYPQSILQQANTAKDATYLTADAQKVIWWINICRLDPPLFARTFLLEHEGVTQSAYLDEWAGGLEAHLLKLKPLPVYVPSEEMTRMANCWAKEGGPKGIVGHNRIKCKEGYNGECCSYGLDHPFAIVMQLLVDRGVESLGHRLILLGSYKYIGVAIEPHQKYDVHAVLDFSY